MYHNIPISYHRPYLMITYFSSRRHHIAGSSSPYLYPYIGYLSSRFLSRFFGIHGRDILLILGAALLKRLSFAPN